MTSGIRREVAPLRSRAEAMRRAGARLSRPSDRQSQVIVVTLPLETGLPDERGKDHHDVRRQPTLDAGYHPHPMGTPRRNASPASTATTRWAVIGTGCRWTEGGVYVPAGRYASTISGNCDVVADDFERPNGLAFSDDETRLYIVDSHRTRNHIRVFDVHHNRSLTGLKRNLLFVCASTSIYMLMVKATGAPRAHVRP